MKSVSIIVPIYNVEKYLSKCLDSLMSQTLKNIEIILVNDGSKDDSLKICLDYANRDNRIKVIDKKNEGVSVARNIGIEAAEGEYIGFVDPDDWIETKMYESLYNKLVQSEYSICICNYFKDTQLVSSPKIFKFKKENLIESDSFNRREVIENIIGPMIGMDDIFPRSNTYIMGCVWRCLYRKSFIDKYQIRFEKGITIMEDLVFNVQALLRSEGICIDEGVWYHYVQHSSSVLHAYNKNMWVDQIQVHELLEKYLSEAGLKEEMQNRLDMRYIGMAFSAMYNEINKGNDNNIRERLNEVRYICKNKKLRLSLERAKPLQTTKTIRTDIKTRKNIKKTRKKKNIKMAIKDKLNIVRRSINHEIDN